MLSTQIVTPPSSRDQFGLHISPRQSADSRIATAPLDRDHLLERLQHLRTIMPAFAHELANARRQAARLRVENRKLLAQVRRLQRGSGGS